MKRSFFISLLLHGAVLLLFFSWGIPLGERSFARDVIQVLLVAEEEEGGEGRLKKEKSVEWKNEMEKREAASRKDSQEKKFPQNKAKPIVENPQRKPEGLREKREERPTAEKKQEEKEAKPQPQKEEAKEERKEPTRLGREDGEIPKQKPEWSKNRVSEKEERGLDSEKKNELQAGIHPPSQSKEPAGGGSIPPLKILPPEAPFGSAPTVLASGSPLMEKEGISLGGGKPSSTDGPSMRMSRTEGLSSEGDSVLAKIVGKIEAAKRYPRTARRMGIQGTATVRFKLKSNGQLEKIELLESSGSKILDEASLETVREAAPLPYKEGWLKVEIVFKIL